MSVRSTAQARADESILAPTTVDYVFFLVHEPEMDINKNEVSDTKWVSKADLEAFFQDPSELVLPPVWRHMLTVAVALTCTNR